MMNLDYAFVSPQSEQIFYNTEHVWASFPSLKHHFADRPPLEKAKKLGGGDGNRRRKGRQESLLLEPSARRGHPHLTIFLTLNEVKRATETATRDDEATGGLDPLPKKRTL
jgi:hypothetical protein